ncbi:AFR117Cp [Eremothecium gossypii ATCC 10895]|uniref:AFR117Cp n=1 Tax=Eremothecium gossypii (strain ATCC 10895 / CBS 109.51 / FGSC 9923 / NRRL Y-1056) TaxID=284811 RepID=Q754F3_EREGS|nr:AFR117Cp [Eremothecium gossypii ATCC 10895]AAS53488.2 AFR117Cp [Eremothecium gossypii ATCC 10895]AEY97800.1 FAFR117Cp [Eremothecium gossypii FDAG1]
MSSPTASSKRKRNRVPLSCTICRKRKVKCDKTRPHCNQCTKTGVAHLCHYMEQTWAGEAEKELSKDAELKHLRERIRLLEEALGKACNGSGSLPVSPADLAQASPRLVEDGVRGRYDNDTLDLTRQFDMLHVRHGGILHLGATHWLAIMKGDPYLRLLWGHLFSVREKMVEWHAQRRRKNQDGARPAGGAGACPVSARVTASRCPVSNQSAAGGRAPKPEAPQQCPVTGATAAGHQQLPPFHDLAAKCPVLQHSVTPTPPMSSRRGTIEHTYMGSADAADRLAQMLPPKHIIMLFLDHFFKYIYPVVPILDEQSFCHEVDQILSDRQETLVIKVTKPTDNCTLGILTIILRLTWLSLPLNESAVELGSQYEQFVVPSVSVSPAAHVKEVSTLFEHQTPLDAVTLARKHLVRFDEISSFSNTNVNLATIQFAIFYKMFLMCCPEDASVQPQSATFTSTGQDNETHQVLLSSIVQMAFSCGLHRDPDNFPQLSSTLLKTTKDTITNTERLKHTWRKMWYFILSLDIQQSLSLGSPRLLRNHKDFSDTKLPFASKIDYVQDIKELVVVKNFTLFFQIDLCVVAVLNHILNVSTAKTVRKHELDSLIEALKSLANGGCNLNDLVASLVGQGLLFTTEGFIDQTNDVAYSLPSMEHLLSSHTTVPEKDKKPFLPHELTTRSLLFSKHITLRLLLYLLNYILFVHYEPKGNDEPGTRSLARSYAQEAMNYAIDGYYHSLLFFNSFKSDYNKHTSIFTHMQVLLAPACLDMGHRALQFMVCLILRAKCGPLTGISDFSIVGSMAPSSDEDDSSGSEDRASSGKELSGALQDFTSIPYISLTAGDHLADTLMEKMALFHKLAKQLSSKYAYATKLCKSTGFFLTLLKKPSSGSHAKQARQNSLPRIQDLGIASMTGFFKNVPSLVFSATGESITRCPVYQDAMDLLPPKEPRASSNMTATVSNGSDVTFLNGSLPPIRPYQPITYNVNGFHKTSDIRDTSGSKRRRISANVITPTSSALPPPLPSLCSPQYQCPTSVPDTGTDSIQFQEPHINGNSHTPSSRGANDGKGMGNSAFSLSSPSNAEISSGSAQYTPDFEEFLMENSNFNGLIINPSGIAEAVGMDQFGHAGDINGLLGADLLPIDDNCMIEVPQSGDLSAFL